MFLDGSITERQFVLLNNEAALSSMSLSQGLTILRKADFVKKAYASHAFFSLSIGIERLIKLILIYDYRLNNNRFPDNRYLKSFGHEIGALFVKAKSISLSMNKEKLYADVEGDNICEEIISFLNDFAVKSRYYNLDILTGTFNNSDEPLKGWEEKIESKIIQKHYRYNKEKQYLMSELGSKIDEFTLTSIHDKSGNHLQSMKDLLVKGLTVETGLKYSMFYTFKIIRFLSSLIFEIDHHPLLPFISEHFVQFRNSDDKHVLKRKTWDLYGR